MAMSEIQEPQGQSPLRDRRAVVEELARDLQDSVTQTSQTWWHYLGIVNDLGADRARALAREAILVEAAGGMMTKDKSRRRTLGGVFFALVQQHVGAKKLSTIRGKANHQHQQEMLKRLLKLLDLVAPAAALSASAAITQQPPQFASLGASVDAITNGATRRAVPSEVEVVIVRRRKAP